jgi:hypothetical protein
MKIAELKFENVQSTPAVAEFVVRVRLEGPAAGCVVGGVVTGPKCPGVTTVELSYPMAVGAVSDTTVSLRCVIPEPNLWTADAPFTYGWSITVEVGGELTDQRVGTIALKTG